MVLEGAFYIGIGVRASHSKLTEAGSKKKLKIEEIEGYIAQVPIKYKEIHINWHQVFLKRNTRRIAIESTWGLIYKNLFILFYVLTF